DGAMTVGWMLIDITYDEATEDDYKWVAEAFNDDEDQSRWFYFKSNGKKVYAESDDGLTKDRTINGKKYAFDEYGAMVAEWSLDDEDLPDVSKYNVGSFSSVKYENQDKKNLASKSQDVIEGKASDATYTRAWKYFSNVDDGARVSRGWFKVVPAEYLNEEKYNDDESYWYYADGSGNVYAGEFKTIKGKKYAFKDDGRLVTGLKFIKEYTSSKDGYDSLSVIADDDDPWRFDSEDDFNDNAPLYEAAGYKCYYFGGGDDGVMRTNKTSVEIDGDNYNFYFEKSGSKKGAGLTGEKDDKYYQSGKVLAADSDDKYSPVRVRKVEPLSGIDGSISVEDLDDATATTENPVTIYDKLDDVDELLAAIGEENYWDYDDLAGMSDEAARQALKDANITKKLDDLKEVYIFITKDKDGNEKVSALDEKEYFLVNTSGKVFDSKGRHKDGEDFYYSLTSKGAIAGIYVED
ncbi:MAG: argininosuccinate lyase, partial [Enterocloster sp.]